MQRRDFCKLIAAAASAKALPLISQTNDETQSAVFREFNTYIEDYQKFCATPAGQRQFYTLENGKFIKEMLDESSWEASSGHLSRRWPPELPVAGGSSYGVPLHSPIPNLGGDGPYQPTWDSLLQYDVPEWYRDAKFGIWAHWTPQCVPEAGDWYALNMYVQGSDQYKYHLEHYGHPSRFGYKDLCAQWTLLNWDPDALIERYKKAGAKLFFAVANHHDGFDAWDSKYQPWNAINIGPHRDVVGAWAAAARKQGLRFGVTVHQARNWYWFQTAHGTDKTGPLAGVPYDGRLTEAGGEGLWWQGLDPQRLYSVKHPATALPGISYVKNFYDRTRDLIDQHDPDMLYFDDTLLPLGWAGMNIGSYFYNHNLKTRNGNMEGIINVKRVPDRLAKAVIADYERANTRQIMPYPWQSETCIGDWHYKLSLANQAGEYGGYQQPKDLIHWMIDTVSKNGTFILNIPGRPDGTIDGKESAILDRITDWIEVNGEAIFATRPWKVYGEGPAMAVKEISQDNGITTLGPKDIRFTRNKAGSQVYAIALGWPRDSFVVQSLGTASAVQPGKIEHVQLLGTDQRLRWNQAADGLHLELPKQYQPKADFAAALKVSLV